MTDLTLLHFLMYARSKIIGSCSSLSIRERGSLSPNHHQYTRISCFFTVRATSPVLVQTNKLFFILTESNLCRKKERKTDTHRERERRERKRNETRPLHILLLWILDSLCLKFQAKTSCIIKMRIRNSYLPPPPPHTLSSLSPKRLHNSDDQITFDRSPESPHVMISRINGRINNINSSSRIFDNQEQNQGIGDEEEEEEEMNFAPANQSLVGGWREEEKAMPLKKRRMVSSEERRDDHMDRGKMVKVDEDLMRCGRTDGRRWRCSRRRVEGYSMCEHHLLTRSARYRSENSKKEIIDEEGDEKKEKGCFGKCENEDANNNGNNNKRKGVKARSINSLLRDTVPLMPLNQ